MADASERLLSLLDPDGRPVDLSVQRWAHILDGHPELAAHLEHVARAVRRPDRRRRGHRAGEEWFYLGEVGPSRWVKVVVHYEGGRGRIVTAFARRSMP